MNKEMTPLQALKKIKQARYFVDFELDAKVSEDYKKELDIIETALKDYEKKTKLAKEYKDVNNVAKRLKAFEIIKECFDLNGFDELVPNSNWFESKEKQDLLRKVLL